MSGDHGNSVQHVWYVNKDVEGRDQAPPLTDNGKGDLPCTEHYCITVTGSEK